MRREGDRMKEINFKYEKVGHVIMLTADDWKRIVEYLRSQNISVTEKPKSKRTTKEKAGKR